MEENSIGGMSLNYLPDILLSVDWSTLLSGAVLGSLTLGIRQVIQAPIKALTERSRFIRMLSWLSPKEPFGDLWEVTWRVDSTRLPGSNTDTVRIYTLFGNITFTTETKLKDGTS